MQRLLRDQRPLGGIELGNRAQEPLPQFHLQAGLDGLWIGPGGDALDAASLARARCNRTLAAVTEIPTDSLISTCDHP